MGFLSEKVSSHRFQLPTILRICNNDPPSVLSPLIFSPTHSSNHFVNAVFCSICFLCYLGDQSYSFANLNFSSYEYIFYLKPLCKCPLYKLNDIKMFKLGSLTQTVFDSNSFITLSIFYLVVD